MARVENQVGLVYPETSTLVRLSAVKTKMTDLARQLDKGVFIVGEKVSDIVETLLTETLKSSHITVELREYLFHDDVLRVVAGLTRGPGGVSAALQGMMKALSQKGMGYEDLAMFSFDLLAAWFVRADVAVATIPPGFVLSMFQFLAQCRSTQIDAFGHCLVDHNKADNRLMPLVAIALITETPESLNEVGAKCGCSSLHHAVAVQRLPQVTKTLLGSPNVDVNIKNRFGDTPLLLLLADNASVDESYLAMAEILLENTNLDVSVLDNKARTALDLCIGHMRPESVEAGMKIIRLMCKHPSATAEMVDRAVLKLAQKEVPTDLLELNTKIVLDLASNRRFSIHRPLKSGKTLGHIAALHGKWGIVSKLMNTPGYDRDMKDTWGKTMLYYYYQQVGLEKVADFFNAEKSSEASINEELYTELSQCLKNLGNGHIGQTILFTTITMICTESPVSSEFTGKVLLSLLENSKRDEPINIYNDFIINISSQASFDINTPLRDGMTLGHLAAEQGKLEVLMGILRIKGFKSHVQDGRGYTIPHYVCEKFAAKQTLEILKYGDIKWDFSIVNEAELSVLEYYMALDNNDPNVKGFLRKRLSGATGCLGSNGAPAADADNAFQTVNRQPREIHWKIPQTGFSNVVKVKPATEEFVRSKLRLLSTRKIFPMSKAKKGKACIIYVSEFLVENLESLQGYVQDSQMLSELWSQMGYEVMVPFCNDRYQLTAQEIKNAVREFSRKFDIQDQSAVICLLSHGGHGYIFGSDGKTALLSDLLKNLDNKNCPAMKNKPKVVIVQACAGRTMDYGVPAGPHTTTCFARSAALQPPVPIMSDFIICLPALPGHVSYVRNNGSIFIRKLVGIFAMHAKEDDIQHMMTWVNQAVAEEDIPVEHRQQEFKQMSHADSCLTKLLYFFPCAGGRQGQNWPDSFI